jgi:superfamily I DNA/RNA helicase
MALRPVPPADWRPRGIPDLEPSAWTALRRTESTSVVAGPGAGKTEFLAQRAAYLLETGLCRRPQQILAISFKTDAAANLAARVRERCPPELSSRFTSMTFDAFTKSLVDRFHASIPQHWRPTRPYDIIFPGRRDVESELESVWEQAPAEWQPDIAQLLPATFESDVVGPVRLPLTPPNPRNARGYAIVQWWQKRLTGTNGKSQLTFVSLNRLAEFVIRANPKIGRALRMTYPFVFVDEFQDTTYAQYDFLKSTFGGTGAIVTAVGDHKQRIMGWAGARTDAFERFEEDFQAHRENLVFNFRSSPELVRVQHFVAQALDGQARPMESRAATQLDRDVVQVWTSDSRHKEGSYLARWIARDMAQRGKMPRDYVLLVRQRAQEFEQELQPMLAAEGLSVRDESRRVGRSNIQDLLVDDAVNAALSAMRLGLGGRNAQAWSTFSDTVYALRGSDEVNGVGDGDEALRARTDHEMEEFLDELRTVMRETAPSPEAATALAGRVYGFLDAAAIMRAFAAYARNDLLDIMMEAFSLHLAACSEGAQTWTECLHRFVGTSDIPMMTVHKSKGLEYDTVFCVGMDDQSWWSHSAGNPEGVATFFVALSRAKQRAIFLFCEARGSRRKVADLYQLLASAGVPEVEVD